MCGCVLDKSAHMRGATVHYQVSEGWRWPASYFPLFCLWESSSFIRAFPWIPWQNHSALLHERANRCRRDKPLPIYISVRRLLASQAPNKQKSQEFVVLSFTSPKMAKRFVCDVHSCGMRFARFEEGLVGYCLFAFANPIVLVVITPGISILSDW